MQTARVEYSTGREVLAAYWGFLSSGGLVLGGPLGLAEGDPVLLDVKIASLKKVYRLAGRVRKQEEGRSFIAFEAGQGQEAMLNAAWADGQGVPERRHPRVDIAIPVGYRIGDAAATGLIVNLSRGGCCLASEETLRIGTRLVLEGPGFIVEGRVRWSRAKSRQMGIEFKHFHDDLVARFLTGSSSLSPSP